MPNPLPPGAAAFLAPYVNPDETAARNRDSDDVYPRGPKFPISFFSMGQGTPLAGISTLPTGQEMLLDGVLTWQGFQYGSGGVVTDLGPPSGDAWLRANNFKGSYHIRPVHKPSGTSNTAAWSRLRTAWNGSGRAAVENMVNVSIADMVNNYSDVVSSVHLGIDDYETSSTGSTDYNYFQWVYQQMDRNDPLKRPAIGSYKGDKSLATVAGAGAWMPLSSHQHYVTGGGGYSYVWETGSALPIPSPGGSWNADDSFRWWVSQYRGHGAKMITETFSQIVSNNRHRAGNNHLYTGLASTAYPTLGLWRNPPFASGAHGATSNWNVWVPRIVKHDLFAQLAAGAEGVCYYTWNTSTAFSSRSSQANAIYLTLKALTESNMHQGLLWGSDKGGVTVTSGRTTCPAGWGPGKNPGNVFPNASSFHFKNRQHGGKRYIVLANSHPVDTIQVRVDGVGQTGLKMVDIFTKTKITPSGTNHTFSIPPLGIEALVVQADDGYVGGDGPPLPAPVITSQPVSVNVVPPAGASFTVGFTPVGATVQWQWAAKGSTTWHNITDNTGNGAGWTTPTYSKSATALAMDGDQFRAVVRTSGGSVTSNIAVLHVSTTPVTCKSMNVAKGGTFVSGTPYVAKGGAWVEGKEAWVVKGGAWVKAKC